MNKQLKEFLESTQMNAPLKLNIQHFSDDSTDDDNNADDDNQSDDKQDDDKKDKTFTKSEVDSQVSKAVQTALDNRDAKHKKDMQQAIDDAIAEKERLSKLSEKERKNEELTQKEKDLAERESEIERKILRSEAVDDLQAKGLPADFADFLLADTAENTLGNINKFKEVFDKAVNEQVKEKLRQDTPPAGGGTSGNKNTIAQLRNKKDQQQNKAPDLWA